MRCFGVSSPSTSSSSPRVPPPGAASCPPYSAAASEGQEEGPPSGGDPDATPRSGGSAAAASQASPTTFNLLAREYTLAVQTESYAEIWSKIHTFSSAAVRGGEDDGQLGPPEQEEGGAPALSSSAHLIGEVLRPDRGSIDEALRLARPGRLTRLVSDYFDSSEHTSRICYRLHQCVDRARALYAPLIDLLDVLPSPATAATTTATSPMSTASPSRDSQHQQVHRPHHLHHHQHLSQEQCDWAFDIFQRFNAHDNPFPAPASTEKGGAGFQEMRFCFAQLKQQLDRRLHRVRARARLLRRTTAGLALCLAGTAVGITVSGLIVAAHALPALAAAAAAPLMGFIRRPRDPLAAQHRRLREHIVQLDAAAKGTFVLNNDLDTIERLVARLHETVESDKVMVSLVLSRGRGERHPIEEVVRQLRRNHHGFLDQLRDLEEHVCLCFAAINRARSLLLQHVHSHHHHR